MRAVAVVSEFTPKDGLISDLVIKVRGGESHEERVDAAVDALFQFEADVQETVTVDRYEVLPSPDAGTTTIFHYHNEVPVNA